MDVICIFCILDTIDTTDIISILATLLQSATFWKYVFMSVTQLLVKHDLKAVSAIPVGLKM